MCFWHFLGSPRHRAHPVHGSTRVLPHRIATRAVSLEGILLWYGPEVIRQIPAALLLVVLVGRTGQAQPLDPSDVPEPLRPWVGWVLDGHRTYGCAWVGGEQHCRWPGVLRLDLGEQGGPFSLDVVTDREVDVALPGGPGIFPREVTVDGRSSPLLRASDGSPRVRVPAGAHRVAGRFELSSLPELLPLPDDLALVSLRLDGEPVRARRNEAGDLWLRASAAEEGVGEGHVELEVYRKLSDGAPFTVTTRLVVRASGEAREITLGTVALAGLTVTELRSDLAARLDAETGQLVAQVRPGSFEITVVARSAAPPSSLAPVAQPEPWPPQEIWVWEPDEALRQVEVSGAAAIDAARTNLPDDWSGRTAYVLTPDLTLTLTTTRRGEPAPPPNAFELEREIWLDLDGEGVTGRDELHGRMNRTWRLDLREGELGRVAINGEDQLITEGESGRGVEVRNRDVRLVADWRLDEGTSSFPAVGWSEDVQALSATLHLPPGWQLLGASGVDEVPGTWVHKWNLWSIFFVLVVSLAIARLSSVSLGLLALLTLTLCYHEPGAPFVAWMFFVPLLALRRAIPAGRVQRVASLLFWCSVAALLLVAVPFAVAQLRTSLYPFTAEQGGGRFGLAGAFRSVDEAGAYEPPPAAPAAEAAPAGGVSDDIAALSSAPVRRRSSMLVGNAGSGARAGSSISSGWVDPNAVVQTGPGIPSWGRGRGYELRWSGPVRADHRFQLYLVPPWLFRVLAVLRVLLLGALVLLLLRHVPTPPGSKPEPRQTPGPVAVAALTLLAALAPGVATAQLPTQPQLDELLARLTRAPECGSDCVQAGVMDVTIDDRERLRIDVEVHARTSAAYRLPGPAERWVPASVTVDGRPSSALRRGSDGFLWLRVNEGVHRVRLEGPVRSDTLTLAFGTSLPATVQVRAPGWSVDGVRADGRTAETIQLQRLAPSVTEEGEAQANDLPAWLVVGRRFELGVRWLVRTTVRRITPLGTPVVLRLPLLEGESVTDAAVQIDGRELVVSVGRDVDEVQWTSILEPSDALVLRAAEGQRYSETWTLACSPIWRCEPEGVPPTHLGAVRFEPRYQPWPGEELRVATSRPVGAEGQISTIDQARLVISPGVRTLAAELDLSVRASQSLTQTVELPEGAAVQTLEVDGAPRPIQLADDRVLRIGLEPGTSRVQVRWQQPGGIEPHFRAPRIKVGDALVNASVKVRLPEDRWLLWAYGPFSDVAVLFWPYLLLVLGVAVVLGRSRLTPLGIGEWFLLGIGLTQIDAWAALVVVGWFFLMAYRGRTPNVARGSFVVRQFALAGYTLLALACLYAALHKGLLMQPEMQLVSHYGGEGQLEWYVDRTDGTLPVVGVLSLPLWVWRVAMLLWALWLAVRLFHWGKWGWSNFAKGGWLVGGVAPPPRPARAPSKPAVPSHGSPRAAAEAPAGERTEPGEGRDEAVSEEAADESE